MWTVVISDQRGQVIAQHEWSQGSLTVGRDQGRSIVLPSKTASRKHCRLDLVNGMPVVVDEGSANGTLVNGARIGGPTRVDEGSKIDVGEFRITLARPQEDESERTVLIRPKPFVPPAAPPSNATMMSRPAAPLPSNATMMSRSTAPVAPPPPPKPQYPAPAMPSSPQGLGHGQGDVTNQFDRHLQSVRAYREESQAATLNRRGKMDEEWTKMIVNARALQSRLSVDKRVLSFSISRDQKEVAIKIADQYEKRGHRYFLLSRDHPEGKFPGVENCWLREFGRDDASFDDPAKAMEELMLRVAGSLA